MPITVQSLTAPGNSTDQASYTTGSITPGANKLILDWVYSIASTTPNTPTASGNALTNRDILDLNKFNVGYTEGGA